MLLKETIKTVADLQRQTIQDQYTGVSREILNLLRIKSNHVLIISGIRRCGKSTLLLQLMKNEKEFQYFNFDDQRIYGFDVSDFKRLDEILLHSKKTVFFFDEVQNIEGWERYVRTKQDQGIKFVITGSNASLLSKEIGTKLTGRHITKELFPFSFNEFLKYNDMPAGISSFKKYFQTGGFPEYLKIKNIDVLQQLFNDIIYRDIVVRHRIRNSKKVKELATYLVSNIGREFSYNNLQKLFDLGSANSVITYISAFEDSYLFFTVPRFSFSYRKQLVNPKKVYTIDIEFARANSAGFTEDTGRLLENLVYLHLRRKTSSIFYFREKHECDFILKQDKEYQAIQVCHELTEDNKTRELNGLLEALTVFKLTKGLVLTFNQEDIFEINNKQILVMPAWKWLLKKK